MVTAKTIEAVCGKELRVVENHISDIQMCGKPWDRVDGRRVGATEMLMEKLFSDRNMVEKGERQVCGRQRGCEGVAG